MAIGAPPDILKERFPGVNPKHFQRWRRYVDAVVILPNEVNIIEAKVWHPKSGIADLLEYRELLPQTPELAGYLTRQINYVLVVPYFREVWLLMAQKHGFGIELFTPEWIVPHLKKKRLI